MAGKSDSVNTSMDQPRVGTEIRVLRSHWFFLNSRVPACRIQRVPGMTLAWTAVDPQDQKGLLVFAERGLETRTSCIIVITRVRRTVCLARELRA